MGLTMMANLVADCWSWKLLPSQNIHHEVFQYAKVSGITEMSLMLCNGGFDLLKKEKRRGIIKKSSIINNFYAVGFITISGEEGWGFEFISTTEGLWTHIIDGKLCPALDEWCGLNAVVTHFCVTKTR